MVNTRLDNTINRIISDLKFLSFLRLSQPFEFSYYNHSGVSNDRRNLRKLTQYVLKIQFSKQCSLFNLR